MNPSFFEVLERAHEGPYVDSSQWEKKIVPRTIKQILKDHDLLNTCDLENPINTDDSLADAYWKAGFELAAKLGILCMDTERLIQFNEKELRQILRDAPNQCEGGGGEDHWIMRHRQPEDSYFPVVQYGALGIDIDEDIFVLAHAATAQYREIDVMMPSCLGTVYGKEVKAKTPYETLVGKYEAVLVREAVRRVGRPEMTIGGVESAATEYGDLGGFGVPGGYLPTDYCFFLAPSPFKTNYTLFHKLANDMINVGAKLMCADHYTMIGGYAGSAEGCAVASVAGSILMRAVHFATIVAGDILDLHTLCNTTRNTVWAQSMRLQAIARNSHMLPYSLVTETHGPCTKGFLYEIAVGTTANSVSGESAELGTRPCGSRFPNYFSGLESKFAAEVCKAAAGMKRDFANEVANTFLPRYEKNIRNPPKGKNVYECVDLKKFPPKPSSEWLKMYENVKQELIDLGMNFDKVTRTL